MNATESDPDVIIDVTVASQLLYASLDLVAMGWTFGGIYSAMKLGSHDEAAISSVLTPSTHPPSHFQRW